MLERITKELILRDEERRQKPNLILLHPSDYIELMHQLGPTYAITPMMQVFGMKIIISTEVKRDKIYFVYESEYEA